MKRLMITIPIILCLTFSYVDAFRLEIIGPENVCPGSSIYTYYFDSNLGGGKVTWTITNGLIFDPCSGQWVTQFSYYTKDPYCTFADSAPQQIKFNNNGNPAIIYVTKVDVILRASDLLYVFQEPPQPEPTIHGDDSLMNCGAYTNTYSLWNLTNGWKLDFWNVGTGLKSAGTSGYKIYIKPENSNISGPKILGAQVTWIDQNGNSCGTRNVTDFIIDVRPPTLRVTGPTQICPGGLYQYYAKFDGAVEPVPGASYTWTYPSGYYSLNGNHNYSLNLQAPQYNVGGGAVRATVTLSCGTFIDGVTIYPYCYGNYSYSASPNPTTDAITIELITTDNTRVNVFESNDNSVQLALINKDGKMVESRQLKTVKETIDISELQPDIYYLKIFINKYQIGETGRIVKK